MVQAMYQVDHHVVTTKWDRFDSWYRFLPPSRPSAEHIEVFRACLLSAIERTGNREICILGSTPELRDLAARLGRVKVVVIDHSDAFHKGVDWLRTVPTDDEELIIDDWSQALGRMPHRFSAVLSDLTLGNIRYEDRGRFFSSIARSLMTNGLFVDRVLTNELPQIPIRRLADHYSDIPGNLSVLNRFFNESLFCSSLLDGRDVIDIDQFISDMRAMDGNTGFKWCVDNLQRAIPAGSKWYYGRPWSRVKQDFESYFRIVGSTSEPMPSSEFAGRSQIISWTPQ